MDYDEALVVLRRTHNEIFEAMKRMQESFEEMQKELKMVIRQRQKIERNREKEVDDDCNGPEISNKSVQKVAAKKKEKRRNHKETRNQKCKFGRRLKAGKPREKKKNRGRRKSHWPEKKKHVRRRSAEKPRRKRAKRQFVFVWPKKMARKWPCKVWSSKRKSECPGEKVLPWVKIGRKGKGKKRMEQLAEEKKEKKKRKKKGV